ncbi:LacI family DNA-binding transcriptional regulator [Afifella sp. IM 167]|uniref:LacI family DNA-binding transcriptional regulator n=1 Tax=Afifella sp. IM 167 TaxID=2033586 RepID=UPI001CCFE56A|nr:LacI family DNA-binding transcriptional regulator [Afifella sp. IM 167]MBZ8131849.1 hypothetical protein [Afifella sp. IM 167]
MTTSRRAKPETVTIRDIAARADVSPITVSRALRGSEVVRPETREHIARIARELGYIPNFAAGMLTSKVSSMIAVIVPNMANSIFATTLQEIGEGVGEDGYQLLIGCSDYSLEREEELVRTFLSRQTDAIVLTGHLHTPATEKMLRQSRVPVVEMWSLSGAPLGVSIGVNNYDAAVTATEHLISRGRRRIAYIGGDPSGNDRAQARIQGYRDTLEKAGLDFDPALLRTGSFEFDTGAEAVSFFVEEGLDVDAIFAASDIIALGVILELNRRRIAMPEKIAVCGFDDARIAQMVQPALTTIKFPRREIGQRVAEALLAMLSGRAPPQKTCDIGYSLIVRETT